MLPYREWSLGIGACTVWLASSFLNMFKNTLYRGEREEMLSRRSCLILLAGHDSKNRVMFYHPVVGK